MLEKITKLILIITLFISNTILIITIPCIIGSAVPTHVYRVDEPLFVYLVPAWVAGAVLIIGVLAALVLLWFIVCDPFMSLYKSITPLKSKKIRNSKINKFNHGINRTEKYKCYEKR